MKVYLKINKTYYSIKHQGGDEFYVVKQICFESFSSKNKFSIYDPFDS